MPMTPFMGVLISWLMLAKKALLARLASSAATLALCSSSTCLFSLSRARRSASSLSSRR